MTQQNRVTKLVYPASLAKRILQGAVIALILISIFLLAAGAPNLRLGLGPQGGWMRMSAVGIKLGGL